MRDHPHAAAADQGRSIIARGKRRCVNQASLNLHKALLLITGYHFIDETVETIESWSVSPTPWGEIAV
jgi:hypothetical protein